jgi:peptide/nickel transport system ATP-binding protein
MGIAIIFISHDLAVIRSIAERVIVMQNGKCVEEGKVATVFAAPQHPYTKGLLACRPDLNRRLKRLATVSDFLAHPDQDPAQMLDGLAETAAELAQRGLVLAAANNLLKVEEMQVWYPGQTNWLGRVKSWVKAVEEVSFSLKAGERLGIVGESGSGKTTLGKAILRLVDLHGGRISFAGQEVSALAGAELRALRPRMQMVFQDPFSSLNPKLTIGQMLLEPLQVHRRELSEFQQAERVRQVLAQVGLAEDTLVRYAREFSGGQRQRIGLARALLLQPELLICDESVSALDVSVQAQVLNLIKDLQEQYQFSLIFISHDLSVIKFIADRVLVMKEGRVVEAGDTETIFSAPQEAYTQSLLAAIP